jgi:hypothetical protein
MTIERSFDPLTIIYDSLSTLIHFYVIRFLCPPFIPLIALLQGHRDTFDNRSQIQIESYFDLTPSSCSGAGRRTQISPSGGSCSFPTAL